MRADGRQRIVAGAPASLTWQPVDADGEPADPGAAVTVGVVRADGTELLAPLTATTGTLAAERAVALTAAQTATLDWLTATWTVSGVVRAVTVHEIVGGVYMTTAAIRAAEPSLSATAKYTPAELIAARDETERAWESECHRAFVPRFKVATVRRGMLPDPDIRAVRFVNDAATGDPVSYTFLPGSRLLRDLATGEPLTVGYEHGWDAPPSDLLDKFARCVRHNLNASTSGIPDRAMSYQPVDGGNVVLATAGLGPWIYGIPDVDQVIHRHRWTRVGQG